MIVIDNLNLIVTRKCNFRCEHCLRGDSADEEIDKKVLERVFKNDTVIRELQLNGGEVFSNPDLLSRIINIIINNEVQLFGLNITSNGTLYSEKIEKELSRLNKHITDCYWKKFKSKKTDNVTVHLSEDDYHARELERISQENNSLALRYLKNIQRLLKSKYFGGSIGISSIVDAGRAKGLDVPKVQPITLKIYYCRSKWDEKDATIVSSLDIDLSGNVCNDCGEIPPKHIYGNIFTERLSKIIETIGTECSDIDDMYKSLVKDVLDNAATLGCDNQPGIKALKKR